MKLNGTTYCRYCGTEINWTRTANGKLLPYDVTGKPHFCREDKEESKIDSGINPCPVCGKACFKNKNKLIDYKTLEVHVCKKADVTRYTKYLDEQKKKAALKKKQIPKILVEKKKASTKKTASKKSSAKNKKNVSVNKRSTKTKSTKRKKII